MVVKVHEIDSGKGFGSIEGLILLRMNSMFVRIVNALDAMELIGCNDYSVENSKIDFNYLKNFLMST